MAARKTTSFRLSGECLELIKDLAEKSGYLSEAQIVEIAVRTLNEQGSQGITKAIEAGFLPEKKRKGS